MCVSSSNCLGLYAADPVVTKRVRTVIEEMVDGKVVSRTEDVDVEVVNKTHKQVTDATTM